MNHDHHRRRHVLLVFGVPRTFEIGIGLLLLVSGWLHIENEFRFYGDILAYRIVGALGATILVTLLPWLHVVVGMAMISGTSFGGCSIIATGSQSCR